MHDPETLKRILEAKAEWEKEAADAPTRDAVFTTLSGAPVDLCSTPDTAADRDPVNDIGMPGAYPYTRGIHANLYRGRLWTMRQFAGFGSAFDTNKRFKYLLEHGQTGLSTAFDMPTLYGYDSDSEWAVGEVGVCGVAVSSLADMEVLFDGIPLDQVSTSMTINCPAPVIFAFYLAVAEKQGVPFDQLRGTLQNDMLKEFIAQKEWIFPPEPSVKLVVDIIEYCTEHVPRWNSVSISGYHIREAGSTAAQELAFTLADGFAYVEAAIERGLDVDAFAPRLSHFFNAHSDFFEEIAKYRAARRIWARHMREKYGAKDPRSWKLRFHTQTAGCSLTAQQPENNIVRTALQALSAVLGGTQSLHTNSMDETLALPTEKAVKIALRTQQIIAEETGVPHTVDPLGGSWFVEALTDRMEEEAEDYFRRIEELGGVVEGIRQGFFQREIGRSAYEYQQSLDKGEKVMVGVNKYVEEQDEDPIETLKITREIEELQRERLAELRSTRDQAACDAALAEVQRAAEAGHNLMPSLVEAAKAYCTLQEICDQLRVVWGTYQEPALV